MAVNMRCPYCNFEDTKVIDSRPAENKKRRRRECANCLKRFTTYESVEMPTLFVEKKDNSIEIFDKTKLIMGLANAVKKRPVSMNDINRIVDGIESHYLNRLQYQASSSEIGDMALNALKGIDHVAYVRFASVYKDFSDVESFVSIISELNTG